MSALDRYLPPLSERATRWLRFFGVVALVGVLGWAALALRDVLTPIVAAFAFAYILNPAVTWLEKSRKVSRTASVSVGLVLLILTGSVLLFAGSVQMVEFAGRVPAYFAELRGWVDRSSDKWQQKLSPQSWLPKFGANPPATQPTSAPMTADVSVPVTATAPVAKSGSVLTNVVPDYGIEVARSILAWVSSFLSDLLYWLTVIVLLPMYTFYFLVHFNDIIAAIRDHLPSAYRPTLVDVVTTIDRSIANFFRGRLMVCIGVGLCAGLGWLIVGVPYSLPLGALFGVLNLIPFMSVMVLPPALFLTYAHALQTGDPWALPVVLVFVVYLIVQAIESFVLSPIIESKASGLHPVAVIVSLLIGNQIAGLLGMLLAIPVASTLKSLGWRYLMPEIRRLAGLAEPHAAATARPYPLATESPNAAPPSKQEPG